MANVLFKRGTQYNLSQLLANGSVTDGCFYLTTDSHRLYVGQDNSIVPVNEGVTTVTNVTALNALLPKRTDSDYENKRQLLAGSFFYVEDDNILCVYNGSECVQINPDTNTDTRIDKVTTNVTGTDENITVSIQLQQRSYDPTSNSPLGTQPEDLLNPIDISFTIDAAKFNALVQEVKVGLTYGDVSETQAEIKTQGTGSDAASSIKLIAGEAISFEQDAIDASKVKIVSKDTTYDLQAKNSAGKAVMQLKSSDTAAADDLVEFAAGKDLTVAATTDKITYSHAEYADKSVSADNTTTELYHSGKFKIISKVESSNGHVTNVETQELTLPADTYIDNVTLSNGILTFEYSTPLANVTVDTTGDYKNGGTWHAGGTLDVYTTEEIDEKISEVKRQANAMSYKGVATESLPASEVAIGDVWMVGKDGLEGYECKIGDLIIATAKSGTTEGTDGYLAAADIVWEVVPSGNDLDTKYDLTVVNTASGAKIALKNTTSTTEKDDVIDFIDDGIIEVTGEKTDDNNYKINIGHKEYAAPTKSEAADKDLTAKETFTAVTGVTSDDHGHLVGYETTDFTLPTDSQYQLRVDDGENKVVVVLNSSNNNNLAEDKFTVESSDNSLTLNVTGTDAQGHEIIDIKHADMEANDAGSDAADKAELMSEGEFKAITGVVLNNGHLVDYTRTTFKLPAADKYTYGGSIAEDTSANKVTISSVLTDTSGVKQTFAYDVTSQSLDLTVNANKTAMSVELVWGTF